MTIFYVESSALVKRYLPERGSEVADQLLDGRTDSEFLVVSILSALELKSVFARLVKGRRITDAESRELLANFWADRTKLSSILPFDNVLIEEAGHHLDRHPVKTLDAIHLAAVFRMRETAQRSGHRLVVVACDQEVLDACRDEQIDVLDPEVDGASQKLKAIRAQG